MSRLDEFAHFCLNNRGNTLSDQLTAAGYNDPAQRASLKAQMRRAMAPGGQYRHLAEQGVVIPGPDDRGDWTEGLDRARRNTLPITLESIAFAGIRGTDKRNLPVRYRENVELAQSTNITGRKGMLVNNALVDGVNNYERALEHIQALEARIDDKDARIEDLQSQVEFMRELLRNTSGNTNAITPTRAVAE
jgi:hypothetical protein